MRVKLKCGNILDLTRLRIFSLSPDRVSLSRLIILRTSCAVSFTKVSGLVSTAHVAGVNNNVDNNTKMLHIAVFVNSLSIVNYF
jgi:hypothetical protein